jgi:TRAP transporter 4TM/12TM fusion protein
MIRLGYPRHFAAAVESTASTGGQITPPIMGAAAFLMVEFLNVPYQQIILAAIAPAFMHFFGVFCQVHFEAKKRGMRGLTREEMPDVRAVVREGWPTAIPLVVLVTVLFSGFTPYLAAFWGITSCMVVGLTGRSPAVAVGLLAAVAAADFAGVLTELWVMLGLLAASAGVSAVHVLRAADGRRRVHDMVDSFVVGAKYAIAVGAAAATVGIIVGVVTLTGVGFKISNIVNSAATFMAGGTGALLPAFLFDLKDWTLFYTLAMTAIVCILLGCGVPTTANYIIMVTVAAPALGLLGVAPIVAHFFVFYYGVLADITPPVALAAYAGASMAGADPFKTGNTAFRLGMAKALVPFVFVYAPALLIVTKGFTWQAFVETAAGCVLGIVLLAAALTGYGLAPMRKWERALVGLGGLLMMAPGWATTGLGALVALPALARQILAARGAR